MGVADVCIRKNDFPLIIFYYIIQNGEHIALFGVCNLNQANNRFYNTMISIRIIHIIHISLKFNQRFFIFSFVNWCLQNGSVGKGICYLHHQIPVFNIQPHNMGKNNKYSRCIDTSLLLFASIKGWITCREKTWKCQNRFIIYVSHAVIIISNIFRKALWKLSLYQCINIQLIYIFTIVKIIELICVDLY